MDFCHPIAFAPFFDEVAVFGGTRLEADADTTRPIALTVPCCVMGGDKAETSSSFAVTKSIERDYFLVIRKADWVDHLPPQSGDTITVEGRPLMRILDVLPNVDEWHLSCRSKEVTP